METQEKINSKKVLFAKKTDSGLIWLEPNEAVDWYGTFLGEVKNCQPHGHGSFISTDGIKYIGEWYSSKSGKGTFTWTSGNKYEGEWSNGKEHGKGTRTLINGAKYKGEFKQGLREGNGINLYSNGDIYDGEWKKGKFHGKGKYTWKDGRKYVGDFKNGEMSGIGEKIWPYDAYYSKSSEDNVLGKSYYGELLNGVPHGNGVWKYRNGSKFEGNFKNGIRWGHGTLFDSNNSIICKGTYIDNKLERNKFSKSDYDDYEDESPYELSDWGRPEPTGYSGGEWSVSDYNTELWHRGGYIFK